MMEMTCLIVYRSGGLGDFVKTWPLLRKLEGSTVVIDKERGDLVNAILGMEYRDVKQWQPCFAGKAGPPDYAEKYDRLIVFRHDHFSDSDSDLKKNIQTVAPNIQIEFRSFHLQHCIGIHPEPNLNASRGPLFHVGAGRLVFGQGNVPPSYPSKAWDLSRSLEFVRELQKRDYNTTIIAGPSQRQTWDHADEREFISEGGFFCENLFELVCRINAASFFIGFDTGPTHIAAQIGKPTIALFGPTGEASSEKATDLVHCEPHGPIVYIIKPDKDIDDRLKPRLKWLEPRFAARAVLEAYKLLCKQTIDSQCGTPVTS